MGVSGMTGNPISVFCLVYVQWIRKMGQLGNLAKNQPFAAYLVL